MEGETKRQRVYNKLPVAICEWHQHVLPHLHRAIASRHIPAHGLSMLHIDAHPDLTFPLTTEADDCFDKEVLYDEIEIADWILPLVYEGHLNKIVWLKQRWATQIDDGVYCEKVGKEKETGFLRVTCKDEYFLEELLYAKEERLLESRNVEICVQTLDNETKIKSGKQNEFRDTVNEMKERSRENSLRFAFLKESEPLILDIDLDFFSTYNPFKLNISEADFDKLTEIYKFKQSISQSENDIAEALKEREQQLQKLQRTILYFAQNELQDVENEFDFLNLLSDYECDVAENETECQYVELLGNIQEKHIMDGKDIDLELIHFAGMSSDLPHHKSTKDEIEEALKNVESFLGTVPRPVFITIARSTMDEYTPPDQVEYIQEKVTGMLERLYDDIDIIRDYENTS